MHLTEIHMKTALGGLRVLDLSRIFAGPWAGQMLADLGAEVIKIERPITGDDTRTWGPPNAEAADGSPSKETGYFFAVNRGKKSVTIDLSIPNGQDLVRKLVLKSDVLIENYKPGTLDRYGLGWEQLRKINPRLIYCSITGFGQQGPYRDRLAYDFVIQAMGGLMSLTGERADKPGGGPQKVGIPIVDLLTGLYAAIAIQAALTARNTSGEGQYIDLAMLDVCTGILANQAQNFFLTGKIPHCSGNDHPNIVPQRVFTTRNGQLAIVVGNDSQFVRFCTAIGKPQLASDPRFICNVDRVTNRIALDKEIDAVLNMADSEDWAIKFSAVGVPCGPINSVDAAFTDPQVNLRGMKFDMNHSICGPIQMVANPIRMSASPVQYVLPPPTLGQHTEDVLKEILEMNYEDIKSLRNSGCI